MAGTRGSVEDLGGSHTRLLRFLQAWSLGLGRSKKMEQSLGLSTDDPEMPGLFASIFGDFHHFAAVLLLGFRPCSHIG